VAVRREIREEVGLELADLHFLCSQPNQYIYKEVTYPVLDYFFRARAVAPEQAQAPDDVAGLTWLREDTVWAGLVRAEAVDRTRERDESRTCSRVRPVGGIFL
jgi:hypothetical protein